MAQQPPSMADGSQKQQASGTGVISQPSFNENDPKYRCCCGCCHVQTGTIIITCLQVLVVLYHILLLILYDTDTVVFYTTNIIGDIIGIVFGVIIVLCLVVALVKKNHHFLIHYLVFQTLGIIVTFGAAIYDIVLISIETDQKVKDDHEGLSKGILISAVTAICIIVIAIAIWFMYVVSKCYVYYRDLKNSYQRVPVAVV